MSEQSKLPWRFDKDEDGSDIVAVDGRVVADMNPSRGHCDANAALIVRAVNSLASNEARIDALKTREKIYKAALERIAASRLNDFGTLHPEGCSAEAKQALHRAALSSHTEQE